MALRDRGVRCHGIHPIEQAVNRLMQIHSVGIELGKTTFHLVALSAAGKLLLRKKFTQKHLITFTADLQTSLIGMEACSGAHFLGRVLRAQGHDVKLIPAQFVKPFVKSNKNNFLDAEAIAEAVDRQNMRFVPIKTDDQFDLQAMHRVREPHFLNLRGAFPLSGKLSAFRENMGYVASYPSILRGNSGHVGALCIRCGCASPPNPISS
jgi:hypothetical protein